MFRQALRFTGKLCEDLLARLGAQRIWQAGDHDAADRGIAHGAGKQGAGLVPLAGRQDDGQGGRRVTFRLWRQDGEPGSFQGVMIRLETVLADKALFRAARAIG